MYIHIIGIAGVVSAPLAIQLKKQGHLVTGSDQEKIYPPISTLIKKHKIPFNQNPITSKIDLVIVGSSFNKFQNTRRQFQQTKKLKIPYIAISKYIAQNIAKKNSILVAGSFGKTTITALLVHIFHQANLHPSYMFGGQAQNHLPSLEITNSSTSIIEADESINGLDKKAKFLYYPVTHAIITSTHWEHKDCYRSSQANRQAFQKLIQKIPPRGCLVYNSQDPHLVKMARLCRGRTLSYPNCPPFKTPLLGQYNQDNICAAFTLSSHLGLPASVIKQAIASFQGIKRRMQIVKQTTKNLFIDDFAQSAHRLKTALQAIKKAYPQKTIKVLFQPQASFLQSPKSLSGLGSAFKPASQVVIGKINYPSQISKKNRVTAADFKKEIGPQAFYLPLSSQIIKHFRKTLKANQILVNFSSGGLSNLQTFKKIINYFI